MDAAHHARQNVWLKKDRGDPQEFLVIQDLQAYQDFKVWKVWKDPKVTKVSLDRKGLEDRKATEAKWVCRVSLVSTEFLAFKVHQGHLE